MVADFSKMLVEDIAGRIYGAEKSTDSTSKAEVRSFLRALAESPLAQKELGLRFGPRAVASQQAQELSEDLESIRRLVEKEGGFKVSPKVIEQVFQNEDFVLDEVKYYTVDEPDTRELVLNRFAINISGAGMIWPYDSGLPSERAQYLEGLDRLKGMHDSSLGVIERH